MRKREYMANRVWVFSGRVLGTFIVGTSSIIGPWFSCVQERALQPASTPEVFYYGAGRPESKKEPNARINFLYTYESETLALIDSIPLNGLPYEMAISANRMSIYVATLSAKGKGTDLTKINATTKSIKWSRPSDTYRAILFSGGELVTDGDTVYSAINGTPVLPVPDTLKLGEASLRDESIPAIVVGNNLNVLDDTLITIFIPAMRTCIGQYVPRLESGRAVSIQSAVVQPQGRYLLAIGFYQVAANSWFFILDIATGVTVLRHRLVYSGGDIAFSREADIAAVTDPSRAGFIESIPTLDLFDLKNISHLKRVTGLDGPQRPGQVRFIRDDKYLVVGPPADGASGGPVYTLRVPSLEIEQYVLLPGADSAGFGVVAGALGTTHCW